MTHDYFVRDLDPTIGEAVAKRSFLRKNDKGEYETWGDVAERVALGNTSLHPTGKRDFEELKRHIASATILTSGRHLQHGDSDQINKSGERHTNCFHATQKVMTQEYGTQQFKDLDGKEVTVKSLDGVWRKTTIRSYGVQDTFLLEFGNVRYSNGQYTNKVIATRNHRWLMNDNKFSDYIDIGDFISTETALEAYDEEGIRHGLVYGDGTNHPSKKSHKSWNMVSQGKHYCSLRLCGEKNKYLEFFKGYSVTYPPHAHGEPVVYVGKKAYWKDLPYTTDPEYISGFIRGWWLADGSKSYDRNSQYNGIQLSTTSEEAVEWLKDYCAYAGYTITGIRRIERTTENGVYKDIVLYIISLACGSPRKLVSISYHDTSEVYCLEEPITSGFYLSEGLKTGNCSTSSTATLLMYLALNGSGVGTCYDDDVMEASVDWKYCPTILCQLSEDHPDFVDLEDINFGSDFFPNTKNTAPSLIVPDSREGWAHAVEFIENMTWTNQHGETDIKFAVLEFSNVRENGAPIAGMQNKPASGPVPLINSFLEVNHIVERARASQWMPWKTAMHVHHTLTACVAYGGVRRIARIATKFWKDKEIFEYISIKKNGGLWTANNSISVDAEFWSECGIAGTHANAVFLAATSAAYNDGTGEPGFLNVDNLHVNKIGLEMNPVIGSPQFKLSEVTHRIYRSLYMTYAYVEPLPTEKMLFVILVPSSPT